MYKINKFGIWQKYKLSDDQQEQLHELIHGEGYGYHEIEQVIKDFFGL